jgi:two-component system CheB/CheR fusion protein
MARKKSEPPKKNSKGIIPKSHADPSGPKVSRGRKADINKTSAKRKSRSASEKKPQQDSFPIVGVGASAGGLEAFSQLLEHLPIDTGMAFVLIQHLAPKHESMLTELLSKKTSMPVSEVKDGMKVEPDHVYVIPPNKNMDILNGSLHLLPRTDNHEHHMPIDYFLRSLAVDQSSRAIGVILSGTASDGALGMKSIKAEGGITFAQDEKSAKYHGMPHSAIAAGYVDFILSPAEIATELSRIGRHPYLNHTEIAKTAEILPKAETELNKIIILVRNRTGVDFTYYKQSTIKRRILRRMVLHKIETLANYTKYLQNTSDEVDELYNDILINVTGFFRDRTTFEVLKGTAFPKIMENRAPEMPIRIWVPGCSTGEEAYSLAICLLEYLGDLAPNTQIQIFGTDISELAIEKARSGIYLKNIEPDVSEEQLRRFFVKVETGYQISKSIRDVCIFARQDVSKDPPFSKMDFVSCRNVLIYLGPVLQKKVLPIFHYALKPNGFLLLGTSETIGGFSNLFALQDKKHKLYKKKSVAVRPEFDFKASENEIAKLDMGMKITKEDLGSFDIRKEADRIVLSRYAPAGVVINDALEILHFRGHTGPYLEPASGEASLNLLRMARQDLLLELRAAIHNARQKNISVKKADLLVKYNGQHRKVNLEVIPFKDPKSNERYFAVLFEDVFQKDTIDIKKTRSDLAKAKKGEPKVEYLEVEQLKQELAATKEYLQSIIEEQEASTEELRSANEEIQSSNEELQSTNEELETAKEELQSTNEELTTVNEELENRNIELGRVNSDLSNLISSVQIPIIMVGNDLHIRRYTPMIEKVLNVIHTDIGRKITDIKANFDIPDLEQLLLDVIETLGAEEREIQHNKGHWYSMRIRPYKTADNKIDGVVISFVDIDIAKRSEEILRDERNKAETYLKVAGVMLLVLDKEQKITHINNKGCELLGYEETEILGKNLFDILIPEKTKDELKAAFAKLVAGEIETIENIEQTVLTKSGEERIMTWRHALLKDIEGNPIGTLSSGEDITELKRTEQAIRQALDYAENIVNTIHEPLVVLDADLRVVSCNRAFYHTFKIKPEKTTGQFIYELGNRQWDVPNMRQLLEKILPKNHAFDDFEVEHVFPKIGRKKMLLNARQITQEDGQKEMILLAIKDVTERE